MEEGHKDMDHFYLVVQGGVIMEKFINLQNKNIWPKSQNTWEKVSHNQKVSCGMGSVGLREHFGLREMLY